MTPTTLKDYARMVKPKRRRPMRRPEQAIQVAFMQWWHLQCHAFNLDEELMWHTPNSAKRGKIEGWMMKRAGLRKGVPDLFLAVPHAGYPGLFVELKAPGETTSDEQDKMIALLRGQGYCVEVCYDLMSAINTVTTYLTARAAS